MGPMGGGVGMGVVEEGGQGGCGVRGGRWACRVSALRMIGEGGKTILAHKNR